MKSRLPCSVLNEYAGPQELILYLTKPLAISACDQFTSPLYNNLSWVLYLYLFIFTLFVVFYKLLFNLVFHIAICTFLNVYKLNFLAFLLRDHKLRQNTT